MFVYIIYFIIWKLFSIDDFKVGVFYFFLVIKCVEEVLLN